MTTAKIICTHAFPRAIPRSIPSVPAGAFRDLAVKVVYFSVVVPGAAPGSGHLTAPSRHHGHGRVLDRGGDPECQGHWDCSSLRPAPVR